MRLPWSHDMDAGPVEIIVCHTPNLQMREFVINRRLLRHRSALHIRFPISTDYRRLVRQGEFGTATAIFAFLAERLPGLEAVYVARMGATIVLRPGARWEEVQPAVLSVFACLYGRPVEVVATIDAPVYQWGPLTYHAARQMAASDTP